MGITVVKVRATVTVCNISVSTPYIQSFNVTKTREQPSTFSASLKVSHSSLGDVLAGGNAKIEAGTEGGGTNTIFTGIVKQAKISPCFDDPTFVILTVSGSDVLSLLAGKKYTRRCRATLASWVGITGVSRKGLKSGRFAYQNEPTIQFEGDKQLKDSALTRYKADNVKDTVAPTRAPFGSNSPAIVPTVTINTERTGGST